MITESFDEMMRTADLMTAIRQLLPVRAGRSGSWEFSVWSLWTLVVV